MKHKTITLPQLGALHALFKKRGFSDEDRHDFIREYTNDRTESSKELTFDEASTLIQRLSGTEAKQNDEARLTVGNIYKLSLHISCLNKGFESDNPDEKRMNYAKINRFCKERTKFRKLLTRMSLTELKEVKKQFEAMIAKEK